jgi:hypothetical protein
MYGNRVKTNNNYNMQVLPQQNCGCQTDHYEEHLFMAGNGTYLLFNKIYTVKWGHLGWI